MCCQERTICPRDPDLTTTRQKLFIFSFQALDPECSLPGYDCYSSQSNDLRTTQQEFTRWYITPSPHTKALRHRNPTSSSNPLSLHPPTYPKTSHHTHQKCPTQTPPHHPTLPSSPVQQRNTSNVSLGLHLHSQTQPQTQVIHQPQPQAQPQARV